MNRYPPLIAISCTIDSLLNQLDLCSAAQQKAVGARRDAKPFLHKLYANERPESDE